MKLIERHTYLKQLQSLKGKADIKIITGIRRSGKSKLLEVFIRSIKENEENYNIIYIDFNLLEFESLKEYHALHNYILHKEKIGFRNYLIIDEVQECPQFEKTINSLYTQGGFDIYLTGSNAFLLSSDLATLFTGRYMEIKVYPFSLCEFADYFNDEVEENKLLDRYLKIGGMPGTYIYEDEAERTMYLNSIYTTITQKDLVSRYNIRDLSLMHKVTDFLFDNIANLTSPTNISKVLQNNSIQTNHNTINNYMAYMCNAFLFYEARRYDIKGKNYLRTSFKYYLFDHSMRFARLGTRNLDYGRVFENIVYLELLRRGYEVYIGKLYQKEIDFVARKQGEQVYIQVSDDISRKETCDRELEPFYKIHDAYPKILLARTRHETYSIDGIKVVDLAKWLLNKEI